MLKKSIKGFTLIELLAVIVILAIIMIIATPMIIKTIEDARKGSFKNSAHGIIQTAEYEYSRKIVKDITPSELTYIYEDGVEISKTSGQTLEFKGEKPKNGTVIINKEGEVALAIHDGTYCAEKGYNDKEVTISEKTVGDCTLSSEAPFSCGNDFLDTRDDNIYKTTQIGEQCWFAENLRYIGNVCSSKTWGDIADACRTHTPSWGGTLDETLYQWKAAMNGSITELSQGMCPNGWHIPSDSEWLTLEKSVDPIGSYDGTTGYRGTAGGKLKTSTWGGTDDFNFTALPAGYRSSSGGSISYDGVHGNWWSSSVGGSNAWGRGIDKTLTGIYRNAYAQTRGSSVRCILG